MNLTEARERLNENLETHLSNNLPLHEFRGAYRYAVLPAGKLFRPLIVRAIEKDIIGENDWHHGSPCSLLSSAIEIHHAYTLVHDDMPCMDDDDIRRGKPSVHKAYGEWKALLVGDGLLNLSYQLISKIKHPNAMKLFQSFSWCVGPKGLIQGQVMDLSNEMNESYANLLRTHTLKTGRLIQAALVGPLYLTCDHVNYKELKEMMRFGEKLGICFQLLDDLTELADEELSKHERDVNPFLRYGSSVISTLQSSLDHIKTVLQVRGYKNLDLVLNEYFKVIQDILKKNQATIEKHIGQVEKDFQLGQFIFLLD